MRIYLIGYMGSGKTSIGKKLSKAFKMNFIDLDTYIEEITGKKISMIFELEGEQYFRKIEQQQLQIVSQKEDAIIATGGGTACERINMDLMNTRGLTIYLEMEAKELYERLVLQKKNRPLIARLSDKDLMAFIEMSLEMRRKYYTRAKYTIRSNNITKAVEKCSEFIENTS
ncbi:MAG TPA: shikimate kinase [Flavobacteriales bacterium]|nr:shikimate kinase [Flavobacteriales bacterium]HIN39513.1 shikimate kinase [Flavobacteriales bacterium]